MARPPRERNDFQDFVLQSVGKDLPMFGYNLFDGVPSTFAPLEGVPVTPDYVIGPGDELLIRGWGAVDIDYRATVERDGTISIPRVGTMNVAGMRAHDIQPYLKQQIGRVFRNFDLNVSLGQLRSIQIFVVGHATRPGAYTVSSLSTLVNAIFASGGPTSKGSMRSIQLKRRDKLVTQFDMYDLLLKGDKSKDVQLLPGDVIHIPPIGPLAAVSGSVNNPAIYEIKNEKTLAELIQVAGGLTTTADGQKVTVERIVERRARRVEEFTLDNAGLAHPLRDGDLVTVLQLSPRFDNTVTVRGNVAVPARHPYRAGMRVSDVVPDREALIVPDYWVKRNLAVRPDVTGRESYGLRPELATDLRSGISAEARRADAAPHERDPQTGIEAAARRTQQVRNEIRQQLPEVNWEYAVIERLNRQDLTTQLIPFNLAKAVLDRDAQNNLALQPGDVVTIFSKDDIQVPVAKQTKFVRLEGEFLTPGVYQVLPGETLRQLVTRVGGFSRNAYVYGSQFTRESVRAQQQARLQEALDRFGQEIERTATLQAQRAVDPLDAGRAQTQADSNRRLLERMRNIQASGRVVLDVAPTAQLKDLPDIALEDGDRYVVPSKPSTVGVIGAVFNQNTFIYDGSKRVSEYLLQAGGATRTADSDRIYVLRADGSVTSKAQGSVFRLSSDSEVMPGDTIVVPENLDRFQLTRELKDWSQIFYQFALGVAGLKVLRDL
ncbi:MAG TPA: polysaccharide biosynthesis/export family protein [Burkholderiales bacterium]|nr:polysaccharide biosynthesis/export family protein [Burkholderiales bacterium]